MNTFESILLTAVFLAFLAGVYGLIYKGSLYLRDHLAAPRPLAFLIIVFGVIPPWCVGIYFAYRAARAADKTLRAIGSMEVLLFLLAAALPLIARG